MNKDDIKKLLQAVSSQKVSPDEALNVLKNMPYEDLGFASIDHHRSLRKGFPEVIYCEGKTVDQIEMIVKKLLSSHCDVLATRADQPVYERIKALDPRTEYNALARIIRIQQKKEKQKKGNIVISTAGTSDIPVAEEARMTAETLGSHVEIVYDAGVAGIHRLLGKKDIFFKGRVIVVVAGMDGAMASVVGGLVDAPVIAVPTSVGYGTSFNGIAPLLTMLNSCASGVAVMNIDNGFGAGFMAHKINMLGEVMK